VCLRGNPNEDVLTEVFDTGAYVRITRTDYDLPENIQIQLGLVLQEIVQGLYKSNSCVSRRVYRAVCDIWLPAHICRVDQKTGPIYESLYDDLEGDQNVLALSGVGVMF